MKKLVYESKEKNIRATIQLEYTSQMFEVHFFELSTGKLVRDHLQYTVDACKNSGLRYFGIPKDEWKEID